MVCLRGLMEIVFKRPTFGVLIIKRDAFMHPFFTLNFQDRVWLSMRVLKAIIWPVNCDSEWTRKHARPYHVSLFFSFCFSLCLLLFLSLSSCGTWFSIEPPVTRNKSIGFFLFRCSTIVHTTCIERPLYRSRYAFTFFSN